MFESVGMKRFVSLRFAHPARRIRIGRDDLFVFAVSGRTSAMIEMQVGQHDVGHIIET